MSTTTAMDMFKSVKDGFASVRKELSLMKAQLVVVKGQQSMTMEKVDGLLVSSAASLAAHAEKAERLDLLTKKAEEILQSLAKEEGAAPPADTDNSWVMECKVSIAVKHLWALFMTVSMTVWVCTRTNREDHMSLVLWLG